MTLMLWLVLGVVVMLATGRLLAPVGVRIVQAVLAGPRRRRRRLNATITELQLQRLTHQAMVRLLDEARRNLSNRNGQQ